MMPIVDPHVGLSHDAFTLDDYLLQSSRFHVLRMVAVQQPQQADTVIDGLHYMRKISTTRGYGGFPNGIVAYCDLTRAGALIQLLENEVAVFLRGVHVTLTQGNRRAPVLIESEQLSNLMENVAVLDSQALSLDVTLSVDQCDVLNIIAVSNPALPIIVSLENWSQWLVDRQEDDFLDRLSLIANQENVHIKLCDNRCGKIEEYAAIQKRMIDTCANVFGYERIMFASVAKDGQESSSFDEQWGAYVDATQSYSARHRDQLFRSNAIRVYRL